MIGFNVSGSIALFPSLLCPSTKASHFIYISTGLVYRIQHRPLREDDYDLALCNIRTELERRRCATLLLLAAAAEFKRTITVLRYPLPLQVGMMGTSGCFPLFSAPPHRAENSP